MSLVNKLWKKLIHFIEVTNADNYQVECDKNYSDTFVNNLSNPVNPASGLPMICAIDAAGNPLGINYAEIDRQTNDYHRRFTDNVTSSLTNPSYDPFPKHYDYSANHYHSNY